MPSQTITTTGEKLSDALKKLNVKPGDKVTITIEVVEDQSDPAEAISSKQQKLLDDLMNIVPSEGSGKVTEMLCEDRQRRDGYNADGFRPDDKNEA